MYDAFCDYHPVINFFYFVLVISFSLVLVHPLAQGISLICVILYCIYVEGKKSIFFLLKYCLPMVFLTTLINPAFHHEGTTVLLYFANGNPLTLESICYGLSSGITFLTVLLWFTCFHRVMTSDKFIYLFGKVIPVLSLVLSMTLRFVPRFKKQMTVVTEAQRSIGRDVSYGSLWSRTKKAVAICSITITWALENAIETADSMKNRGYGLKGRTAFSIYYLQQRDIEAAVWFGFCGLFLLSGILLSVFGFRCFPNIRYAVVNQATLPFYLVYFGLCITPVIFQKKENKKWKIFSSKG